jgi:hypothetical protein
MAVAERNLARWIFSSVAAHFEPVSAGLLLPYYVEGVDERSEDIVRDSRTELRITGPFIREMGPSDYRVDVTVNILLTQQMAIVGADAYSIVGWAGRFQRSMLSGIPIYKFGDGADDDGTLIDCLRVAGPTKEVKIFHFGQISNTDRLRQSEVDAEYTMDWSL